MNLDLDMQLKLLKDENSKLKDYIYKLERDSIRLNIEITQEKQKNIQLRNTLSFRFGNRIVNSKTIGRILSLPFNLYKDYKIFKKEISNKNKVIKNIIKEIDVSNTMKKFTNNLIEHNKIRIASIMDEFTYECFKYDCDLLQISPYSWKNDLDQFKPDIVFIESAWNGKDSLWRLKISSLSVELCEIIKFCKDKNIPTIFWNKEDPVHFDTFLDVAKMVDFVFTTDIDCVPKYKYKLKHKNVYCLPFAAQTKLHNPIEKYKRKDEVNFAGSYYLRYPQRQIDFDIVFNAVNFYKHVSIYDRNYNNPHPHYTFPECYKKYIIGGLSFNDIDIAYKGYDFGITINTVKYSQSMFARRAFELIACNTLVISNFSRALRNFFGDLVVSSDNEDELKKILKYIFNDKQYVSKIKLLALRKVMSEHTYKDRLNFISSVVFDSVLGQKDNVYIFSDVKNQHEYDIVYSIFEYQSLKNKILIIIKNNEIIANDDVIEFLNYEEMYNFLINNVNSFFGIF
ncbi:glycosyltransferase, partial [Campylobacter lari]|nr:glycosyltransferase [Campylobacter lari]